MSSITYIAKNRAGRKRKYVVMKRKTYLVNLTISGQSTVTSAPPAANLH